MAIDNILYDMQVRYDVNVEDIPKEDIEILKKYKRVHLCFNTLYTSKIDARIESLPEAFRELTQLESLTIESDICELPSWFGEFKNLKKLDLELRSYADIPVDSLFSFEQLEYLSVNFKIDFPKYTEIHRLQNLRILDLSNARYNDEDEIRSFLKTLPALETYYKLGERDKPPLSKKEEQAYRKYFYNENYSYFYLSHNLISYVIEKQEDFNQISLDVLREVPCLHLYYKQALDLPPILKDLGQLESLVISYPENFIVPEWFGKMDQIKKLKIVSPMVCGDVSLLFSFSNLNILDLRECKLEVLPKEFILPNIQELYLSESGFMAKDLLAVLEELPLLEKYELSKELTLKYSEGKEDPDLYNFNRFYSVLCKNRYKLYSKDGFSIDEIRIMCALFKKDNDSLQKVTLKQFYRLLNCSVKKYRELILQYLNDRFAASTEDFSGKKIYVAGTLSVPKKEYKPLVEETGGHYVTKPDLYVDYIVLGEKPGKYLDIAMDSDAKVVIERIVWNSKDTAYLQKENNSGSAASLEEMLQSSQSEQREIAFQIMEQGGVPEGVMESVIAIMLFHPNKKVRSRAATIFNRYNTVEFSDNSQKLLTKSFAAVKDDKKITTTLKELVNGTPLDISRLSYTVYLISEKLKAIGLCLTIPGVSEKVMIDYTVNGSLNFSDTLTTSRYKSGNYTSYCIGEDIKLSALPIDIEQVVKKVEDLNYDYKIDVKDIPRLKGLRSLSVHTKKYFYDFFTIGLEKLSWYYSGKKLPEDIFPDSCTLKSFSFSGFYITAFPSTVCKLENLEYLYLSISEAEVSLEELHSLIELKKLKSLTIYCKNLSKDDMKNFITKNMSWVESVKVK
jgi:Leucine-rich repeat (LRR) protein